ncbi:sugar transferase [Calditrichota bacterium]
MNYFKRDTLELDLRYFKLLLLFNGVWLLVSIFTKKFNLLSYPDFKHAFLLITRSNLYILYLISATIVLAGLYAFSRIQLMGTCLILFTLELGSYLVFYLRYGKTLDYKGKIELLPILKFKNISLLKILADINLFTISFFLLNYYKRITFTITPEYEELFLVIFAVWLLSSVFTRKFEKSRAKNIYYVIAPYFKSFVLAVVTISVFVYALNMFFYSRLQIFGTFTLALFLEISIFYIYYIFKFNSAKDQDIETIQEVQKFIKQVELPFDLSNISETETRKIVSVKDKLKSKYLINFSSLFDFINSRINLEKIDENDTCVLNTHTLFNIEILQDHSIGLFINLHKINDMRWLNRYFLEVHKKINNGGFFIGSVDTIKTYKTRFYKKYSRLLATLLYPLNFIYKRVLPKLPVIKKIYFIITKGKNRTVSKAEALGRLYFCGFKIIDIKEISDSLYFIAQRVKEPSFEQNPSYGPTIKLKRIGLNAELMYINKFRTMHPYSEFLQEYIYEQNKLQPDGKFKDDFRLTTWGKIFRRLWIDELPQLINFWQGDINLVGVRALSQQYFDLYPQDLKEFRTKVKPGLVPPYYADLPKSFDEIVESERKYLQLKQQHPFTTDVKYFFKIFYNIIFKNARSH